MTRHETQRAPLAMVILMAVLLAGVGACQLTPSDDGGANDGGGIDSGPRDTPDTPTDVPIVLPTTVPS